MIAQKAPMQYSTVPPPPHTLRSRLIQDGERRLLNQLVTQKQIPMFVFGFVGVIMFVVAVNVIDFENADSSVCAIFIFFGVIALAAIISSTEAVKPIKSALSRGTVTDITAPVVANAIGQVSVGPVVFNPGWVAQGRFPVGATVTIGFVQTANYIVSVNGIALSSVLGATPTHDIVALEGSGQFAVAATRPQERMIKEIRYERGGMKKVTYAEPAAPMVIVIVKCSKCGASMQPEWKACPSCGASVIEAPRPPEKPPEPKPVETLTAKCDRCGRKVDPKWKSCPECGTRLGEPAPKPAEVPKPVEAPKTVVAPKPKVPAMFCPFHGSRTIMRDGKAWCTRCRGFLDEPAEFCPFHGCKTELKDGEAFCPRCDAIVEPL